MYKIQILNAAESDIEEGMIFYENQSDGLGLYFLETIMSDIQSLQIYCGIHIKIKEYYRLLSKRFPYSIYYKYTKNTIFIYAVFDCRQNPKRIEEKLR